MKKFFKNASLLCLVFALLLTAVACKEINHDTPKQTTPEETTPEQTTPEEPIAPHVHSFGSWQNLNDLDEGEEGEQERICACGETETRTVCASVGLAYRANEEDGTCIITGPGECSDTILHVPAFINGYRVVSVWQGAFGRNADLVEVSLPNTLLVVDCEAFFACKSLEQVSLPNSLENIEISAFLDCKSLTSIFIPTSVNSISVSAFSGCENLESIIVDADSVKFYSQGNCIIDRATQAVVIGCKASAIPNGVVKIGEHAFAHCNLITTIDIPESVMSIDEQAFYQCRKLETVILPQNVKSIGSDAFLACTALKSITIPSGVTDIVASTFKLCYSLETIIFTGTIEQWSAITFGKDWNEDIVATEVICSDGVVPLN